MPGGFSNNDIRLLSGGLWRSTGRAIRGSGCDCSSHFEPFEQPFISKFSGGGYFEPLAFTAVADGQIYMQPNETAREAVLDAINGWDPSEEALYYFNPDTATSPWIWGVRRLKESVNTFSVSSRDMRKHKKRCDK